MLLQRIITALVLLPLLLAAVWYLPTPYLYTVLAIAGALIAWEWAGLMSLASRRSRLLYVAVTAALLSVSWLLRDQWVWLAGVGLLWWMYAGVLVRGYPGNFERRRPGTLSMALFGQLLILPAVMSLAVLHGGGIGAHDGSRRLLYVFFLIFAADTGAYFAGRAFGRRKLAPAVSPGKSVEGAIGGLLLCAIWALTGGVYVFHPHNLAAFVGLSLLVAAVSILGDLTESLFKRAAGVKDSGKILPGHGGLFDRTDSLLAAAPLMALGLWVLRL